MAAFWFNLWLYSKLHSICQNFNAKWYWLEMTWFCMEMQELDKVYFALRSSIPCGCYALPQEVWQKQAIRTFQDHITP